MTWTHDLNAYGYDPRSASIGNLGTEVFVQFQGMGARARLLSAFDGPQPTPVWETPSQFLIDTARSASAAGASLHAAITVERTSFSASPAVVLRTYRSASPTAQWSYTFPFNAAGGTSVGVEVGPAGERVLAWTFDWGSHTTKLCGFGPNGPAPLYTSTIDTSQPAFGSALSADGSTLLLTSTYYTALLDATTGSLISQILMAVTNQPVSAISSTGTYCAVSGTDGGLSVFKRQGTAYAALFTRTSAQLGGYVTALEFDAGEGRLAVALANATGSAPLQLSLLDTQGSSHGLVQAMPLATSSSNSRILDLAFTGSPSRALLVATSGDATNSLPELVEYAWNGTSWGLASTLELPEPVAGLQASSRDGRVCLQAYGTNSAPPNQAGRAVVLWDTVQRDLCCSGTPHAGAILTITQSVPPLASSRLLQSPLLAVDPALFPGVGTLYLQTGSITTAGTGTADDAGTIAYSITLPSGAGAVGTQVNLQGFRRSPRRLSQDFVHLTILP